MAQLLSVNVGLPREITWRGRTVHTAVWKAAVAGKRMVRRLNIDGDGQGDLVGHGGEQRAVLVYQIESYRYWEQYMGRSDFAYGQFGDNFTVAGLPDDKVCIGDRYRIGDAFFEVTQPRVTCYRVGIRMAEPRMAALLVAHHRPGFYLRVLKEGEVEAGDSIVKVRDGPGHLTVTEADALLYLPGHDHARLKDALRIAALSEGWKTSFRALTGQQNEGSWTGNAGLALGPGPPPAWPGYRPMRVAAIRPESRAVFSLDLEPADGGVVTPALPGQFITLRLSTAARRAPLVRSYSLSGSPAWPRYRIGVKQEPHGAAGTYLHEHARSGDVIDVAAPRGTCVLRPGSGPVVLLSAGIGITPLLAMLHALADAVSPRPVWWVHGARNGAEHPFAREVDDLVRGLTDCRRCVAYSRPLPSDRRGFDFDLEGRLSIDVVRRQGIPRDADFYVCGPDAFMRDASADLAAWGVEPGQIRTEVFGPGRSVTPGIVEEIEHQKRPPHPPAQAGTGPRVSFVRSGLTVNWDDNQGSLLELAEACDLAVRWSCRTGVCHTCVSGLLDGSVAYQPEPLEYPAQGSVLICCAKPQTEIALDI
jgi:ferredoxin-NADP reductase/MOSC domain-containing protein YiiM